MFTITKIKGYEISHFYSFDKMYKAADFKRNKYKLIGIDMDLIADGDYYPRCWGNHPTGFKNKNSANINVIQGISNVDYFKNMQEVHYYK